MRSNPAFRRTRLAAAVAGSVLALAAGQAMGSAFALQEQSASSLGNAFAGGAAFNDDASAMYFNPAALSSFKRAQAVAGLHFITPSIKFNNDGGSLPAAFQPLGGNGGDAGSTNYLPNLYLAVPLPYNLTFGLGVNAPFGLVTEYDQGWIGRFQAIKSDVKTINVNPAISWQATPELALGLGVNWQRIDATFTSQVNYSGIIAQTAAGLAAAGQLPPSAVGPIIAATPGLESGANISGDDDAWGWNIGATWQATPNVRLAAAYRSDLKYKVSGNADFSNPTPVVPSPIAPAVGLITAAINNCGLPGGAGTCSSGVTADIKLPGTANLSVLWNADKQWEVMADVQWTHWSVLKELKFVRTNGVVLTTTPENFRDTWRFSAGASYKYNEQWKARFGMAYDQTPVNDTDRTPRLPDSDRVWLSLGGQYKFSPNLWFDAGFTYIWNQNTNINQNEGSTASYGLLKGGYDANVTIFSIQGTYQF